MNTEDQNTEAKTASSPALAVAPCWAIRLDEPRVLDAVTGVNRRSLELAAAISDAIAAVGYRCTPMMEIELSNRIANHVLANEWPEAAKFYAASLPNTEISRRSAERGSNT